MVNGKIISFTDKVNTLGLTDKSLSVDGKVTRSTDKVSTPVLTEGNTKEAIKMA